MEIHIKGNDVPAPVLTEFGRVADHARLQKDQVHHDAVSGTVTIILDRLPIVGVTWFGTTRHTHVPVQTRVTIRNVTDCQIKRPQQEMTFTILFGLKIEEKAIYFCSVEEDHGEPLLSIDCRVSELDLEVKDD